MVTTIERADRLSTPLRYPVYRRLWAANTISVVGTLVHATAAAWLVFELTGSATWVALMTAATMLPTVAFGLIAGAAVDLVGRARVMIVAHAVAALAAVAVAVVSLADAVTPLILLLIGLVLGVTQAFHRPAWNSIAPDIVPEGAVAAAVRLNSVSVNIARIVGPVSAGFLLAAWGPEAAFAVNAASFAAMVGVLIVSRPGIPGAAELHPATVASAIATGIRYARHTPLFRRLMLAMALFALVGPHVTALLPARSAELSRGAAAYGVLFGVFGVGTMLGVLSGGVASARLGRSILPAALTLFGIGGVLVGFAPHIAVAVLGLPIAGVGWMWTNVSLWASAQLVAPGWVRGRAMSIAQLIYFGILSLGGLGAGALADRIGVGEAGVIIAMLSLGLSAAMWKLDLPAVGEIQPPTFTAAVDDVEGQGREGGPVVVVNSWIVDRSDRPTFTAGLAKLRGIRLGSGAQSWDILADTRVENRIVEMIRFASWEDHLAMHRRLDDRARALLRTLQDLAVPGSARSRHLVGLDLDGEFGSDLLLSHEMLHRTDGSVPLGEIEGPREPL